MFRLSRVFLAIGIPFVLSTVVALHPSFFLLPLLILAHLFVMKLVPAFRGRENLWMFLVVSVSSIPLNIAVLVFLNNQGFISGSFFLLGFTRCLMYYFVLLSVEEVVMGVITRMIWKKQNRLEF